MKTSISCLFALLLITGCASTKVTPEQLQQTAATIDYGDFRSETLTTRAWNSLEQGDYAAMLGYTNKVIELYAAEAKRMNAEMRAFEPTPTADQKWALNDVGTSLFIMGQGYEAMSMNTEAIAAYHRLTTEFGYAQCWDPKGWYWRPAEAAQARLQELQ